MAKPTKLAAFIATIETIVEELPGTGLWPTEPIKEKLEEALFAAKGIKRPPKPLYDLFYPSDNGVPWCRYILGQCEEMNASNPGKYPADMYEQFLTYWSAPNALGVPKWWETYLNNSNRFHVPGRLSTWFKNYRPPLTGAQYRGKLFQAAEAIYNAAQELKDRMRTQNA